MYSPLITNPSIWGILCVFETNELPRRASQTNLPGNPVNRTWIYFLAWNIIRCETDLCDMYYYKLIIINTRKDKLPNKHHSMGGEGLYHYPRQKKERTMRALIVKGWALLVNELTRRGSMCNGRQINNNSITQPRTNTWRKKMLLLKFTMALIEKGWKLPVAKIVWQTWPYIFETTEFNNMFDNPNQPSRLWHFLCETTVSSY